MKVELWRVHKLGEKPKRTWQEATVRWIREKQYKRTIEGDKAILRWLDPFLGDKCLDEIDRDLIDEIAAIKEACGDAHLKVILETGELGTLDRVRRASVLAMHAGADFIKTSTGKIQPAATMQVTLVMLQAIRDYYYETGRMVGMKPAGGISSAKLAVHYLVMLHETLGNAWMTPEWFRFGASSLANDVLMQLMKQSTGVYQSADYFSKD